MMEFELPAGGTRQAECGTSFRILKFFLDLFKLNRFVLGCDADDAQNMGVMVKHTFLHDQAELYIRLNWSVEAFIVGRIFDVMCEGSSDSMNTKTSQSHNEHC